MPIKLTLTRANQAVFPTSSANGKAGIIREPPNIQNIFLRNDGTWTTSLIYTSENNPNNKTRDYVIDSFRATIKTIVFSEPTKGLLYIEYMVNSVPIIGNSLSQVKHPLEMGFGTNDVIPGQANPGIFTHDAKSMIFVSFFKPIDILIPTIYEIKTENQSFIHDMRVRFFGGYV